MNIHPDYSLRTTGICVCGWWWKLYRISESSRILSERSEFKESHLWNQRANER